MKYKKNFYQIKSNQEIFNDIVKEKDTIGYYNLPFQDTTNIKNYVSKIEKRHIVIVGIGGSSLGTRAIYEFLLTSKSYTKQLHFLETTDPLDINHNLKQIDLTNSHFVIISKSGTTIETISLFKYLSSLTKIDKLNCTIISEDTSKLTIYAKKHNIKVFFLDENVGGRFSVFSVVGLVPLAMVGIDIDNLLNGCKKIYNSFFNQDEYYDPIIQKARFLVENKNRFNINVLFSYSSSLDSFNKWYVQLWGESLGKFNINNTRQSLTPIGLIGPVDQHSFLQLIIEGVRDKTITFIKIDDFKDTTIIPANTLDGFDDLDYIDNLGFQDLINKQADATIQSVKEQKDIPCDVITIRAVDEYNIAKLMFIYQLLTSCVGKFVQINTYNQPGVESGKIILKKNLQGK
jgi:glucose-6-phosphate isomerase